jgi:hypothetical protein
MTESGPSWSADAQRTDAAFDRAQRAAFLQDMLAPLRNQPADLLPFEEVRERLALGSHVYKGLQEVPLDRIVGSVARYHDFNRAFRPRHRSLRSRWKRVKKLEGRLPPIELYQVGEVYFVVDGNHRVSVARETGALSIQAYVWEYKTRVPVESNDDLNDILVRREYLEFLEQSRLDINRPRQRIVFTVPGAYRHLGEEIARYREWLDHQHIYSVSFEEAAADWYDNVYLPMAQVIREHAVMEKFPGRTEADLVGYVLHYRDELLEAWFGAGTVTVPGLVDLISDHADASTHESRRRAGHTAQRFVDDVGGNWWSNLAAWVKRHILRWEILDRGSRENGA